MTATEGHRSNQASIQHVQHKTHRKYPRREQQSPAHGQKRSQEKARCKRPHGSARVTIPEDTMHSFEFGNTKVVWSLKVTGDVPSWPDVDEEFDFVVRPSATDGGRR